MCDPISMAVVAVASTAASIVTQAQAAKSQEAAIRQTQATQEQQIRTAEVADINDRARAQRKEAARIKTAAGEAGLSLGSGSIENLLMDSLMQQNLSDARTSLNAGEQIAGSRAQAGSMLSQVQTPTLLGAGLQLGLAGYGTYKQTQMLQIRRDQEAATKAAQVASGGTAP